MSFEAMTWAVRQELPALQKLVLLMLANRTNPDTGRCDPSHDRLATDCGMSKTAVKTALAALRDAGKIEVIHRSADGVNLPNHYRLLMNAEGVGREPTHPGGESQDDRVGRHATQGEAPDDRGVGRQTTTKQRTGNLEEEGESAGARGRSSTKELDFDFEAGRFLGPIGDHFGRWRRAYPAINVEAEVERAAAWLYANPANRKSNYVRFLTNWMSRAQERAPRVAQPSAFGAMSHAQPPRRSAADERAEFMQALTGRRSARDDFVVDV